jgi:hypothetical protein
MRLQAEWLSDADAQHLVVTNMKGLSALLETTS